MENDFRAIMADDAALTALVAARIYPVIYPQSVAGPAVRFTIISSIPGLHMQGSDGLTVSIVQVDIRAKVAPNVVAYSQVLNICNVLIGAHGSGGLLHPFRGVVGSTDFRLIRLRDKRGPEHEKTAAEEFFTASLDFDVWSKAAA